MIKLVISSSNAFKSDFWPLFETYQKELMKGSGENWEIVKKENYFNQNKDAKGWFDFLIYDDDTIIGLVSLQNIFFEKPKMLFIAQFYIKPQFRRKGYGTKVLGLIKEIYVKKETSCWLYMLKNYELAKAFWSKAIEKNKFEIATDDRCYIEGCENYHKVIFKNRSK